MADELTRELARVRRRIEQQAYKAMKQIAARGEFFTREDRGWEDDTHSAEESITGYVIRRQGAVAQSYDWQKNFGSRRWQLAQLHGSQKYKTPPSNFYPERTETYDVPDENDAAIITMFVKYGEALETGFMVGSLTFKRSFDRMTNEAGAIIANQMRQI